MAQRNQRLIQNQADDGNAEWSTQRVALLKSLEYLYFEACAAKISLVATLIGAAVEALKDDLAELSGAAKFPAPSRGIAIRDFGAPRMLIDDHDLADDDFIAGYEDDDEEDEEEEDLDEDEGRRG